MAPPNNRAFIKLSARVHRFWYRLTGGRIGGRFGKAPILLLTTTGRTSGKQRTTPLIYLPDGDDYVVVGSNGGDDRDPDWWKNLKKHPDATVQIRGMTAPVRAEQASADERARLWPQLTAIYRNYDEYTKRTSREIPVILLRRG